MLNIGVDVGGTTIKMALVTDQGEITHKWNIPTNTDENGKSIVRDISRSIIQQRAAFNVKDSEIRGVGLGVPGFINVDSGFIYDAVNLGWKNYSIRDELEQLLSLPVVIENDANAAALGEMWLGAGKNAENMVCVTLGTGIGGGIIVNGDILHGISGMAGELGHLTVKHNGGARCNCGKTGCLETISSATGIRRMALEGVNEHSESLLYRLYQKEGDISSENVFNCAEEGDAFALALVDQAAYYLGSALGTLSVVLNPERIIIGGGVSNAGETLTRPLIRYFKASSLPRIVDSCSIDLAKLGNDAGVIGCAWLSMKRLKRNEFVHLSK
ncbi:ROK family glucokinase [Sporolactobacillus kofuensis]|nr:ROK family glucokinase [Sporolactobacillus kofuensis]